MKKVLFIILLATLISCTSKNSDKSALPVNEKNSLESVVVTDIIEDELIVPDTITKNTDLKLVEITTDDFEQSKKANKSKCEIDENGFIQGYGLKVETQCEQICESYLVERRAGQKMFLPSSFDQGLIGMRFSPSCNHFYIFSSYDGPDYKDFYDYRSEIIGYSIIPGKGLQTIKHVFNVEFTEWSIESVIWISDKALALKVYEDHGETFKYYKAEF